MELGVEPGAYEVRMERAEVVAAREGDGGRRRRGSCSIPVSSASATLEHTARRGGDEPFRLAVDGRNRVEMHLGMWRTGGDDPSGFVAGVDIRNMFNGVRYTRYLREDLALTLAFQVVSAENGVTLGSQGQFAGIATIMASPVGLRWNPLRGDHRGQPVKPYLAAAIGPIFGASAGSFSGASSRFAGESVQATVGGHIGGGVDFHVARGFSIGVNSGYNWMVDFTRPVGSSDNYSGPEFGLSFGWLFGKGHKP